MKILNYELHLSTTKNQKNPNSMKAILLQLFLYIICIKVGYGQKNFPQKPSYILQLGDYSFPVQSVMLPNSAYSPKCACDSMFTRNILFKNEIYNIKIPLQKDTVVIWDLINNKEVTKIDTIDHIQINKLIGTLSKEKVLDFLASATKVNTGKRALPVDRVSISIVLANGKQFQTSYSKGEINGINYIKSISSRLSAQSYLIINSLWFLNEQGKRNEITGRLGWLIN